MNNLETNVKQQSENYVKNSSGIYVPKNNIESTIYKIVKPTEEEIMQHLGTNPLNRVQLIKSVSSIEQYASLVGAYRR